MGKCPEWLDRHIKNTEEYIEKLKKDLVEMRKMKEQYEMNTKLSSPEKRDQ